MDWERQLSGFAVGRGREIDLLRAKVHQLANPQCMQEGHADQEPITDRVATIAGGVHQLGNLGFAW